MLATDTMLAILDRLASVWYVFYEVYRVSWHADRASKNSHSFLTSYFSQITSDRSLRAALFHIRSLITPRSLSGQIIVQFTLRFSLPSNFWCSSVDGDVDRSSPLWTAEAVLSNYFIASEAAKLNPLSKIAFIKNISLWRSRMLTLQAQPTKHSASSAESRETSSSAYYLIKAKRSKLPFSFGLLSADEPPASHYENPPQVFQPTQQTLTMEEHHPSHYLFYQILPRRLWQNLNQEVHLRHLPHLLSQSFRLSCPVDDDEIFPVTHH